MAMSLIPYIGGKHRIAHEIAKHLHATGKSCLVDVFGGSAAVTINAGFTKRVYNDADGDLVNLFRVIAGDGTRRELLNRLRWTPPSRRIFEAHYADYLKAGFSFAVIADPVERALRTFYRHHFSFGGKVRCGGFSVSVNDRPHIKEVGRYRNSLERLAALGSFFRDTMLENLQYSDCISAYGVKSDVVLFVDPPYVGTENYYSVPFGDADHVFLSHQLAHVSAAVVCTYYDDDLVRQLYPEACWSWHRIAATKNSQFRGGQKTKTDEYVIVRKV